MNVVNSRTLPVALALMLIVSVHGVEYVAASRSQPKSGCADCQCTKECGCRGPVKSCGCGSKNPSLKANCKCGCSEPVHIDAASSCKSTLAPAHPVVGPHLTWSLAPEIGTPLSWRLAHEHEHPPRAPSERVSRKT